jgi:hypothetical protein
MENKLAPVAIFVYNRLSNTKEVIEALQRNYLAKETDVFIFSDAAKTERQKKSVALVRDYLKTVTGFKSFNVIERTENFYVEKNIIEGVTEIVNRFGNIIVLEDDGVTSPYFLTFMNKALKIYAPIKKVMHIATFTFIKLPASLNKTFFWSYSENTGGGWATWKDRWATFQWFTDETEALAPLSPEQRHKLELDGTRDVSGFLRLNPIPWDICWNIAIAKNNGLAVNSPRPLIRNNGLYNGTHFYAINKILGKNAFDIELDTSEDIEFETRIEENKEALELLKEFYARLGKRKRDMMLHYFVRILVFFKITKILKRMLK